MKCQICGEMVSEGTACQSRAEALNGGCITTRPIVTVHDLHTSRLSSDVQSRAVESMAPQQVLHPSEMDRK
jgi:hypothetical protein